MRRSSARGRRSGRGRMRRRGVPQRTTTAGPDPVERKIDDRNVVVVPGEVGAGLATMTISNQSSDDVQLDFDGPNRARSAEIATGEAASIQFELKTGDYTVEPSVPTISPGTLTVGPERPTASNELELP